MKGGGNHAAIDARGIGTDGLSGVGADANRLKIRCALGDASSHAVGAAFAGGNELVRPRKGARIDDRIFRDGFDRKLRRNLRPQIVGAVGTVTVVDNNVVVEDFTRLGEFASVGDGHKQRWDIEEFRLVLVAAVGVDALDFVFIENTFTASITRIVNPSVMVVVNSVATGRRVLGFRLLNGETHKGCVDDGDEERGSTEKGNRAQAGETVHREVGEEMAGEYT